MDLLALLAGGVGAVSLLAQISISLSTSSEKVRCRGACLALAGSGRITGGATTEGGGGDLQGVLQAVKVACAEHSSSASARFKGIVFLLGDLCVGGTLELDLSSSICGDPGGIGQRCALGCPGCGLGCQRGARAGKVHAGDAELHRAHQQQHGQAGAQGFPRHHRHAGQQRKDDGHAIPKHTRRSASRRLVRPGSVTITPATRALSQRGSWLQASSSRPARNIRAAVLCWVSHAMRGPML